MPHLTTPDHRERAKVTIRWRGQPRTYDAVVAKEQTLLLQGTFVRTAQVPDEWQDDVRNPEEVIRDLKTSRVRVDLLRFWQRIPDVEAAYPYYHEWQQVAAIPITTHKHWFEKQADQKARNKIRKALKRGVETRHEELSDQLIRRIMEIFNESPVRRGKPFWHYGKDFPTVKMELSDQLDKSIFITAYYQDELIGFIKLVVTDRYAMASLILDKMSHRDKAPMNALISKAVEVCEERRIPYITYTVWRRGAHGQFQASNGFIKVPVPEYFVPLTLRGRLALRLNLHRGIKGAIPERVMVRLLELRARWYERRPLASRNEQSSPA